MSGPRIDLFGDRNSARPCQGGAELPALRVFLLGDFRLVRDGEPVTTVGTARLRSLLAYLVLYAGAPQSRQYLAFRLWPDSTESQARTNLRQLLYHLRHSLPDPDRFLRVDARTLQWRADAPYGLDVADFERAVARADEAERRGDLDAAWAALEEAVELYRGDLLPGCYEDWIEPERERLRQQYTGALERLVQQMEDRRVYGRAVSYARLLLRQDPLREDAYRWLMRLHALNGDRAGALRAYHTCATILRRELGVDPDPSTLAMYERLLNAPPTREAASRPASPVTELPLVGRQREWKRLRAAWRTAADGRSHVVLVTGDAGIGKTRLAEELLRWAARQGVAMARTRCYAAEGRLAYAPVADWLRADALREPLRGLDDVWLAEVARLLPEIMVERPELGPPEPLAESWQRRRLFEALARAVLAADRPLLLLIDDLQWCDAETLEWLRYLARFEPSMRLLIVGTVRTAEVPEDHPLRALLLELHRAEQVDEIPLGPLEATETASLAAHVAGRELDEARAAHLYRETEGNPLFVVESVRAKLQRGDENAPTGDQGKESTGRLFAPGSGFLPPKVHAVLAERLEQLSPQARELAGVAATIGRSFTFSVLAGTAGDEESLVRTLDELWRRRIVREHGADAYDFSHDKIREVAYARVGVAHRRMLHRRVAEALETVHASDLDPVSGQLAAHYRQAGMPEQAIQYYRRAGEGAIRLSAYGEAVAHLTRGLELLEALPDSPERARQELGVQVALGGTLTATKGWAAPEVERAYERARTLCRQAGEMPKLFPVLWGLYTFYIVRAELRTARRLGEECLRLAQSQDDPAPIMAAHLILGISSFHLGELVPAREHLERAIALYDPRQHRSHTFRFGPDPGVFGLSYASHVLWYLGYPDQALERSHEALTLARERSHPYSLAIALDYGAMLHQFRREWRAARERAEAAIKLCSELGFAYYLAWATIIRGWSLVEQREKEDGIAQMRRGLADLRATGAALRQPYYLALLAEACGKAGQAGKGMGALTEALASVQENDQRYCEAELYRLKGDLLLTRGEAEDKIERCLRQALEIARRQSARSLELRAATSLTCLWRKRGREAEARTLLEEIHGRFTEGFDTPDLKEAGALLKKLS